MPGRADIEAGRAFVSTYHKDAGFQKGMNAASAKLKAFGGAMTTVGAIVAASGIAVLGGLAAAAMNFANVGSDLNDMSQRLTMSAQELAELGYAAEQTGAKLSDIEKATRFMRAGGFGTSFVTMAEEIAAIEDPLERTSRAMEVFGKKTGSQLKPMIEQMAALRAEARAIGVGLSQEDVETADRLGDAYGKLQATIKAMVLQVGAAVAPMAIDIIGRIQSIAQVVSKWIRENRQVFVTLGKVAAIAVVVGSAIAGMGGFITAVGVTLAALAPLAAGIFAALKVGFMVVGVAIGLMLGPIGWFVGMLTAIGVSIVGLTAAWLSFTDSGKMARDVLVSGFQTVMGIVKEVGTVLGGIAKALLQGEFSAAGRIAFLGLKLAAIESLIAVQSIFKTAVTNLAILWNKGLEGWFASWGKFAQAILGDVKNVAGAIQATMERSWDKVAEFASKIGSGQVSFDVEALMAAATDSTALKDLASKTREELQAELNKLRSEAPANGGATGGGESTEGDAAAEENEAANLLIDAMADQRRELAEQRLQDELDRRDEKEAAVKPPKESQANLPTPDTERAAAAFVTFQGAALGQQGAGGVQERILDVNKKQEQRLAKIEDNLQKTHTAMMALVTA